MGGVMRGVIAPESEHRTITYRSFYTLNALPNFERNLRLYSYTPKACPPPKEGEQQVQPEVTPLVVYAQGTVVPRLPIAQGAGLRADEALELFSSSPNRRIGAPGARWRVRWHDGTFGHEFVADVKAGSVAVVPMTSTLSIDLLIADVDNLAAVTSKNEDLDVTLPNTSDNIYVARVAAGAAWPQPNNFPDTLTLTDWFRLFPVGAEPPFPPVDLFVPIPAYARRVRWDFGETDPALPLPSVSARWVLFNGDPPAFATRTLGPPVDIAEEQCVFGSAQGILFSSDPVESANVDVVWSLEL